VTKSGERWSTGAEDRGHKFLSNVPVALFHETATQRGSWLECNYAEALDLGQKEPLIADADVTQEITIQADPETLDEADSPAEAMADGGVDYTNQRFRIDDPGMLTDVLVDLHPDDDDVQGMRVSTAKYSEVYPEKTTTEEMQMQEVRGRAAEVDPESQRQMMFRFLKYFLGGVLLARSPEILALLLGDGGTGINAGEIAPILIGVF